MSERIEEILNRVLIDGEDDEFPDLEGEIIKNSLREFNNRQILEIL